MTCKCKCPEDDVCGCTPLPADWAIKKAIDLGNETEHSAHYYGNPGAAVTVEHVKRVAHMGSWFRVIAFARYIEQHEEPPVDPDLILAREIYAEQLAKGGYGLSFINDAKTGKLDRYSGLVSTLTGIKEGRKLGSE